MHRAMWVDMHWYARIDLRIGIRLENGRARVSAMRKAKRRTTEESRQRQAEAAEDVSLTKIRFSLPPPPPAPASITSSVNESSKGLWWRGHIVV